MVASVPFNLSVNLAVEGLAAPAWAYKSWLRGNTEAGQRVKWMLVPQPRSVLKNGYIENSLNIIGWMIALICAERWGALSEWIRIGLIRLGLTSPPPAQKSSWIMRGLRQGLAILVCAMLMGVVALINPMYDSEPIRVEPAVSGQALVWGSGAVWLASHKLLP